MSTVYIVSDSGHDYSTASKFGTVQFLFNGKINVFASDKLVKDIKEKLKNSTPDDCLLPSGNSMATCVAFAVLLDKHSIVNLMIWSFRNKLYEVRSIRVAQVVKEVPHA